MEPYQQLEHEVGAWAGFPAEHVVACSSGTAALHLALEAMQLPPGAEVIVPDFTMIACARAVTLAGLVPVLVDCKDDLLIDPGSVKKMAEQSGSCLAAIVAVHTYGRSCLMEDLCNLGEGLYVVEDLAESHGIKPHPRTDAACYSFYRNKVVAGEEGGAVAFRDKAHADLARCLRSQGFTDAHDFTHIPRGHNYRLSNANAKLILPSLRQFPENLVARRRIEGWYDEVCPAAWRMPPRDVPWVYDLRIPGMGTETQDAIVRTLQAGGIPARHAFKPMSMQEEYRGARRVGGERALTASREVFYLPIQPGITTSKNADQAFGIIQQIHARAVPS